MWTAWLAFSCVLGGAAWTIAEIYGATAGPEWALLGILAADIVAAVLLFATIWRGQGTAAVRTVHDPDLGAIRSE